MLFTWLQTFNTIVEKGSLTRAARELHLTQPAVSKQLRSLEKYYGAPLFRRTTRELELTEAGRIVYRHSRQVADLLNRSLTEVQRLNPGRRGEILIGASTIPGEYLVAGCLARFQQEHPGIRIRMEIGDTREIAEKVLGGQLELGITGARIGHKSLRHELLCRDELLVVVPAGHHLAGRGCISLEEFLQEPLIAREEGSGTRLTMEKILREQGLSPAKLRISLELGSTEAVLNAVAKSAGISLVSNLAVKAGDREGRIATLRIKKVPLQRDLLLVTRKNTPLNRNLQAFIDFLKRQLNP